MNGFIVPWEWVYFLAGNLTCFISFIVMIPIVGRWLYRESIKRTEKKPKTEESVQENYNRVVKDNDKN